MIAALPMYDRPETARANDQFWNAIRKSLGYGPANLTREMDIWDIWQSPDLLLAQTCGFPYRARLHGHVTLIGTPDYGLPDCPAGYYNSLFVARRHDSRRDVTEFQNATFAYNDPMSQSGWASPIHHVAGLGARFAKHIPSGGHIKSAHMVADQRADIAAIDAVTWAMIAEYDSFANMLHVIGHTTPTPGLPFITAYGQDRMALLSAINSALDTLSEPLLNTLRINSIIDIPAAHYLTLPTAPAPIS